MNVIAKNGVAVLEYGKRHNLIRLGFCEGLLVFVIIKGRLEYNNDISIGINLGWLYKRNQKTIREHFVYEPHEHFSFDNKQKLMAKEFVSKKSFSSLEFFEFLLGFSQKPEVRNKLENLIRKERETDEIMQRTKDDFVDLFEDN